MAVERVDVNLPSGVPADVAAQVSQSRLDTQEKVADGEKEAAARKAAERKLAEKKETLERGGVERELLRRESEPQQKMQRSLAGAYGAEAHGALAGRAANHALQVELTAAQKSLLGPFMQSPKGDAQVKNDFLRFGLRQAVEGKLSSIERAGDMLGALAASGISGRAQRAAMGMVVRAPDDARATASLASFVQHPDVRALPAFARGKATEILARASGKTEVKQGLEQLASEPKLQAQTADNQGRFFATIGSGKPSELRALTDLSLAALRSRDFPTRAGQVGRFLGRMAAQVRRGGASAVDVNALVREAKRSPLPAGPRLMSTEGLDEDEAACARAQNRGRILHYFNQLERLYERGEKKLAGARYLEDVNALQTLREPPPVDTSALAPEELAIYQARSRAVSEKRAQVLRLHQQRSRELRNERMPLAKRRAMLAERRAAGRQPRYFQPGAARSVSASGDAPAREGRPVAVAPARQTVTTDGWGVPRVFDRDLVGTRPAVKPPVAAAGPAPAAVANEYTGRPLVKDHQSVRPLDELLAAAGSWKDLSKPEQVLLRNLGWSGQTWSARHAPAARWPVEMATAYMALSPARREAVHRLGLSAADWDARVLGLGMGNNA